MIVGRNSINVGVVRHVPGSWGSRGSVKGLKVDLKCGVVSFCLFSTPGGRGSAHLNRNFALSSMVTSVLA